MRSQIRYSLEIFKRNIKRQCHGWLFIQGSVAKVNGNRNVPYLNRNDSERNLNLNWRDNDWNAIYRFLAVRYSYCFSSAMIGGVLFNSCRFQPPSIFPTSAKSSESRMYFLLSKALISHDSCRRSLIRSTFDMLLLSKITFSWVWV